VSQPPEQSATIRTFLVMENCLLRDMLARVLRRRKHLEVVGRDSSSKTSLQVLIASRCDVLLSDFVDADWLSLVKSQGKQNGMPLKIVAVGMDSDPERFLEAVRCGVVGYLLKDASASDVVAALQAAVRNEATCPPQLCTTLFQIVARIPGSISAKKQERGSQLTVRQHNLLKLVANGLTNKEIARELSLSEFTVRNHISRILKHLHAENRNEAARVVWAREHGDEDGNHSDRLYTPM